MRNMVLQIACGEGYKEKPLSRIGLSRTAAWCERIGVEHVVYDGPKQYKGATTEKLRVFNEEFDEYDWILVLDVDMFPPSDHSVNIFDTIKPGQLVTAMPASGKEAVTVPDRPSGGSIMYSKEFRIRARNAMNAVNMDHGHCGDECFVRDMARHLGTPIYGREQKWDNYPPREGGIRKDFYLVHFVQNCRDQYFKEEDWT